MSRLQGLKLSLKHLNTSFLKPLVGIMYGFKHGQNETIAFNLKPTENLKEGFAFVQSAVVWFHFRAQPLDAALKEYEEKATVRYIMGVKLQLYQDYADYIHEEIQGKQTCIGACGEEGYDRPTSRTNNHIQAAARVGAKEIAVNEYQLKRNSTSPERFYGPNFFVAWNTWNFISSTSRSWLHAGVRIAPLVDVLRRRPEGSPAVGMGRAMEMTRGGGSELAAVWTGAEVSLSLSALRVTHTSVERYRMGCMFLLLSPEEQHDGDKPLESVVDGSTRWSHPLETQSAQWANNLVDGGDLRRKHIRKQANEGRAGQAATDGTLSSVIRKGMNSLNMTAHQRRISYLRLGGHRRRWNRWRGA
ncbi:hypothetical protein B0H13DRAFT_1879064 [Mycena leptocephala]|nr:hypothetical protein B0H13DRAFT_1879064 [Mycena leptocephala]